MIPDNNYSSSGLRLYYYHVSFNKRPVYPAAFSNQQVELHSKSCLLLNNATCSSNQLQFLSGWLTSGIPLLPYNSLTQTIDLVYYGQLFLPLSKACTLCTIGSGGSGESAVVVTWEAEVAQGRGSNAPCARLAITLYSHTLFTLQSTVFFQSMGHCRSCQRAMY